MGTMSMKNIARQEFLTFADAIKMMPKGPASLVVGFPFMSNQVDAMMQLIIAQGIGAEVEEILRNPLAEAWEYAIAPSQGILLASGEEFGDGYHLMRRAYRQLILASLPEVKNQWAKKLARIGLDTIYNTMADYVVNISKIVDEDQIHMATLTENGIEAFLIGGDAA